MTIGLDVKCFNSRLNNAPFWLLNLISESFNLTFFDGALLVAILIKFFERRYITITNGPTLQTKYSNKLTTLTSLIAKAK